jgi:hypothetical protein
MNRLHMHRILAISTFLIVGTQALAYQAVEFVLDEPDYDRWVYPFNGSPGERPVASTFSAYGSEYDYFDDRDGQVLLGFHTDGLVQTGFGASSYRILSATMTIMIESDDIVHDDSIDSWETHLEDGDGDGDAGRPVVVSGVGFRNGWDGWSYGESGPFGDLAIGGRNVYPVDFDSTGAARDISNNLTQEFDPSVFGVGQAVDVPSGEIMPTLTTLTFTLAVDDPDVQCYLRSAVDDGLVSLLVSSLHAAGEQGQGGAAYPDWIMKDNALVFVGLADAAGLEMTVEVVEPSGIEGDVDGDGLVGVTDLLDVISDWGRCPCCPTDLNDDGFVDVNELLNVISNWGG